MSAGPLPLAALPLDTKAARRYGDLAVRERAAMAWRDASAFNPADLVVIDPWTGAR